MKKLTALLAAAVMVFTMAAAGYAETATESTPGLFAQIRGLIFEFSSGVGGWSTELVMGENGVFTGNYHDSEMGETGEGYPDGTMYGCSFHGQLSELTAVDEYTWTARITVDMDEGQAPETIEDGIRYVTSAPYGVEKAQTVTIYVAGTPIDRLPEGFIPWSHLQETDPEATAIPYFAIWSEEDEAGFVSYDPTAEPAAEG